MSDYSRDNYHRTPYFPRPTPKLRKVVAQAMSTPKPQKEIIPNTIPRKSDHPVATNHLHEQDLYRVANELRRTHPMTKLYTLVYPCKDFHNSPFPFCYLVQKPADSKLHAGLFNFPGGHIDMVPSPEHTDPKVLAPEEPKVGALRELKEETGLEGSFPQLCGLIAPLPPNPDANDGFVPYLVYCFKAIIAGSQVPSEPVEMRKVTDSFQWKDVVPNIPLLAALFHANVQGWILQEPDFRDTPHAYEGTLLFTNPDNPYKGYAS